MTISEQDLLDSRGSGVVIPEALLSMASRLKRHLESEALLNTAYASLDSMSFNNQRGLILPVISAETSITYDGYTFDIVRDVIFMPSKSAKNKLTCPHTRLKQAIAELWPFGTLAELIDSFPWKWEKYDGFLLLPENAFYDECWLVCEHRTRQLLDRFAAVLKVDRIARKSRIPPNDPLRRPCIEWLFIRNGPNLFPLRTVASDNKLVKNVPTQFETRREDVTRTDVFWTSTCQNNVRYIWAPEHSMFSSGNITEKTRVVRWKFPSRPFHLTTLEKDLVVLDLYAGIGYFTLAFLASGKVGRVIACEWNPWSIEGLKRGASINNFSWTQAIPNSRLIETSAQLIICQGNNEAYLDLYRSKADHVSLGLIPSSEQGWPLAVQALKPSGGFLHVHSNILEGQEAQEHSHMKQRLGELFLKHRGQNWSVTFEHCERVKSFRPKVWHWVIDVFCLPQEFSLE